MSREAKIEIQKRQCTKKQPCIREKSRLDQKLGKSGGRGGENKVLNSAKNSHTAHESLAE